MTPSPQTLPSQVLPPPGRPGPSLPAQTLVTAIRVYQAVIRPLSACHCRFYPRCSDYGITAVTDHGAWRGGLLAGRRVLRCNPWVQGGYDPVPAAAPTPTPSLPKTSQPKTPR